MILSQGTISLRALVERKITAAPIVFVQVTDPVGERFVESLARPGGNITGFANFGSAVARDRLRFLKNVVPGVTRVMVVRDAAYPTPPGLIRDTELEAQSLGIELHAVGMKDVGELDSTISGFGHVPNGALVVLSDPFTGIQMSRIIRLAEQHRLPAIYSLAAYADAGGLLSYGVNLPVMWRGAAEYIDRILRGAKPNDLTVQQPADPEIVVNMKTATTLGLTLPAAVLGRATRIIQ